MYSDLCPLLILHDKLGGIFEVLPNQYSSCLVAANLNSGKGNKQSPVVGALQIK